MYIAIGMNLWIQAKIPLWWIKLVLGRALMDKLRALVLVSGIFLTQAAAGLPSSMYPYYKQRWNLTAQAMSLFFVVLICGVVVALVLCQIRFTARTLRAGVILAAVLSAFAGLGFASQASYAVLLVSSGIQGLGLGLFTGLAPGMITATAGATTVGKLVTVANAAGLALGPFLGGVADQFAPAPHQFVFYLQAALSLGLATALPWASRSTTGHRLDDAERGPGTRLDRRLFVCVALSGFAAFALGGLYSSLGPLVLSDTMNVTAPAILGSLVTVFFAANAIAGPPLSTLTRHPVRLVLGILVGGCLLLAAIVHLHNPALFFAVTVLLGAGQGAAISRGVATSANLVESTGNSRLIPTYFLVCYLGTSVSALGGGALATALGPLASVSGLAVLVAVLIIVISRPLIRADRKEAVS